MNAWVIAEAEKLQSACFASYSQLHRSLEKWIDNGSPISYQGGTASCNASDRDKLSVLVGDLSAVRSEAYGISKDYSEESVQIVDRIIEYANARTLYDRQYVENHTELVEFVLKDFLTAIDVPLLDMNPAFSNISIHADNLVSCISVRGTDKGNCDLFDGARDQLDDIMQVVDSRIAYLLNEFDSFAINAEQYKENAQVAYGNALKFYNGARGFVGKMKSIVAFFDNDWLSEWYDIPPSSFYTVEVNFPDVHPEFNPLPSMDELWSTVSPALNDFYENISEASLASVQSAKELQTNLNNALSSMPPIIPSDYDPPKYLGSPNSTAALGEEKMKNREIQEVFLQKSAIALDAYAELSKTAGKEQNEEHSYSYNFSSIANKVSTFEVDFEEFTKPSIDFNLLFLQLGSISEMTFFLDFVVRLYFSARLIFKYWDMSSIVTPIVDLRAYKRPTNPLKMSPLRLMFLALTNWVTGMVAAGIFFLWLFAVVSSIYAPLFDEYRSGCVDPGGNGTFITANFFSTAHNFAAQDGSTVLIEGLSSFDNHRVETCSRYRYQSINQYQMDRTLMSSLRRSNNETRETIDLYQRCLDIDEMDVLFQNACCGKAGYDACDGSSISSNYICPLDELISPAKPYLSPGTYLEQWNAAFPLTPFTSDMAMSKITGTYLEQSECGYSLGGSEWNVDDAVFDCDKLPSCDVTCEGPSKERLHESTRESGCMVEWYIHSMWLQMCIALVIFAITNVTRVAFIDGLTRVYWDDLRPEIFNFTSSCQRDGKLVHGSDGAQHDLEERIQMKLSVMISRFKFIGYVMIILAISVNISWVYLLAQVNDSIAPYLLRHGPAS
eukprot:CAMPEP_0116018496 /NCGR_PEP_ID=MMETSP0321-20121206/8682_1 /TAXON_ID=163516 /ORGANISM="Leptocylindrus danicus var. danicus, Strain B650" /LENGTH=837 /DNA_ID=CAMNT_0003488899 /DNA_START=3044 /DNA_END=5558 /DNA_ORIENTATION=-